LFPSVFVFFHQEFGCVFESEGFVAEGFPEDVVAAVYPFCHVTFHVKFNQPSYYFQAYKICAY